MLLVYNLLWLILFPVVALFLPLASLFSGKKRNWRNLLGQIDLDPEKLKGKRIFWFQVPSVGEIATTIPIIKELKGSQEEFEFIISVTTEAGYRRANDSFPDALYIFYSPIDFYPFVSRLIRKIRPVAILIVETGLWPNLLYLGKRAGAAAILVNGRISERTFRNYKAVASLIRSLLNMFDLLITRDDKVAERFRYLGARDEKIVSFGDVKYDTLPRRAPDDCERFRKIFSISPMQKIIMAGNTHEGEEEFLLDIFDELKARFNNLIIIFAPRRLERVPRIEKMLSDKGRGFVKRTELGGAREREKDIIILDSMGELSKIYFICHVVFVGKSIFAPGGGHSLLEPVAAGKIAFHGPYVQYYEEAEGLLNKAGLAKELNDSSSFIEQFSRILAGEAGDAELAARAERFLNERMGASKTIAKTILRKVGGVERLSTRK